jgi:hypothetical protein
MSKKILLSLLCAALAFSLVGRVGAAPAPLGAAGGGLSFDDFLTGHLSYPAKQQAEAFLGRQEKLATRPATTAAEDTPYGKAGCTPKVGYNVGDERSFWVSGNVANTPTGNQRITATLAAKSPHGYLWVQKEYYLAVDGSAPEGGFVTQGEAKEALLDWEKIYGINREYFGHEPNPNEPAVNLPPGLPSDWRDADCDVRVSILNFPIDTPGSSLGYIAGYYSSEHEYPNGDGEHESPFSNETEMFFMNSATLDVGDDTYAGVLAHEFFHMIQFSNDYNEATWVNEGMADIAAVVNGFGDIVEGHVTAYEEEPDNHLFHWGSEVADYGQAFLFFDYLFNHYGDPEVKDTDKLEAYGLAKLLTRTKADGPAGVARTIAARSDALKSRLAPYYSKASFGKVFKDYLVANYLDKPDAAQGQFGYANRDVKVATAGTGDSAGDTTVHSYAGDYYEIAGGGTLNRMITRSRVTMIPATQGQPQPKGGFFSWSNRADEMITYLERKADLGKATAPTLRFKYWYQIEEDWDYAYVRVSTDRGNTYRFVNTSACGGRATDPNGNNRAVLASGGITGDSDGWRTCSLDLTEFAGGPVLVRFEYDTDQAVTEPGFVVDNVKLTDGDKTIWRTTKFEKRTRAFRFGGNGLLRWLRIKPLAKNRPLFQVINLSGATGVTRRVLTRKKFEPRDGLLLLKRPLTLKGDKTVLIFSGTTPITTTPFGYSYEINR